MSLLCIEHQSVGDGFVVACGTRGWLRGSSRCHRRLLGRHYDDVNNHSSMSSTRKRCWFGGVFVTGGTGGFLLWKSPVRPAVRVLRRDDCNFVPVNNFWAFDEFAYTDNWTVVFFVCIFHWYFTMSNILIINITHSSEFLIYMFMSVWRICRRLWHCGLSLWQPARPRRLWDSDSDSDSDKFIQQKYIQVPYQVYMSFLKIQITL